MNINWRVKLVPTRDWAVYFYIIRLSFKIPCPCGTIHTLIFPDVDVIVWPTGFYHRGYVSDDVKVFK